MAAKTTLGLALLFLNTVSAAHSDPLVLKRSHLEHALHARQSSIVAAAASGASSSSAASPTVSSAAAVSGSGSAVPPSTLTATNPSIPPLSAIVSGMPSQATPQFTFTLTPGATPPFSGAPPLPTSAYALVAIVTPLTMSPACSDS